VLLRLAYLGVTNAFAVLRLLPMSDRGKNIEILALRHQITVLERQLGKNRLPFAPSDRALLAAARAYFADHGTLAAPRSATALDRTVGQRLSNQRRPGALGDHPERAEALTAIDPDWNPKWPIDWQRHYAGVRECLTSGAQLADLMPGDPRSRPDQERDPRSTCPRRLRPALQRPSPPSGPTATASPCRRPGSADRRGDSAPPPPALTSSAA
jgi:hypothetical protein